VLQVVDLEDPHLRIGIAVREGVETCSENQCLAHSMVANAGRENVFREACAADHERAESRGEWLA
jgi:hypothetical protein